MSVCFLRFFFYIDQVQVLPSIYGQSSPIEFYDPLDIHHCIQLR